MEKALLLSPSQAETVSAAELAGCSTLIVGSEFCQNQIPSAACVRRLGKIFPGNIALASSLMTDTGLARWEGLLRRLGRGAVSQVIVNDWGLLPEAAKAGGTGISLGNLLVRELVKMDRGWVLAFIRKHGVTSAETDSPDLAAYVSEKLGLKVSWHKGLLFRAVTTYCPFERHYRSSCGHSCEGKTLKLSNRCLDFKLVLAENAYFTPAPAARPPRPAWREVDRFPPAG